MIFLIDGVIAKQLLLSVCIDPTILILRNHSFSESLKILPSEEGNDAIFLKDLFVTLKEEKLKRSPEDSDP
ncbi:hypothetical protein [Lysinibacillus xylanilyticus]|nr:hypothetical protein [Lysinibacillus xylanilyticus]